MEAARRLRECHQNAPASVRFTNVRFLVQDRTCHYLIVGLRLGSTGIVIFCALHRLEQRTSCYRNNASERVTVLNPRPEGPALLREGGASAQAHIIAVLTIGDSATNLDYPSQQT